MLSRIFTGTILSIGCILTVQAAEIAFDKALAELDTALAAPVQTAPDGLRVVNDCNVPDQPCDEGTLFVGELRPDIGAYLDCERAGNAAARLAGDTA